MASVGHPDQPLPSAMHAPGGNRAASTGRRAFLRGLVGVAGTGALGVGPLASLAGCDIFGSDRPPVDQVPPELASFLTATVALGDRYDAALAAVDSLPATIGQIRDAHWAHARAIAQAIGAPTPSPSTSRGDAPTDRDQALAALVTAEKAAHEEAIAECLASSARFAALLGSIAAARATHLVGLA
jgi:hypothetical protein